MAHMTVGYYEKLRITYILIQINKLIIIGVEVS